MTAANLAVGMLGFRLEPRDRWLAVQPASKPTAKLAADLRHHKTEIICLLMKTAGAVSSVALCQEWGAVPPDHFELVTLKPTPTPANRELITAYVSRQCAFGNAELRIWLTRRPRRRLLAVEPPRATSLRSPRRPRSRSCRSLFKPIAGDGKSIFGLEKLPDMSEIIPSISDNAQRQNE